MPTDPLSSQNGRGWFFVAWFIFAALIGFLAGGMLGVMLGWTPYVTQMAVSGVVWIGMIALGHRKGMI